MLSNYDSGTYFVDQKGSWEDAEPISDYREEVSDADLHQPAAVDDNHIVFYNEDEDHIEVMNMIPKHHMDSLHNNPDDETRTIKRAKEHPERMMRKGKNGKIYNLNGKVNFKPRQNLQELYIRSGSMYFFKMSCVELLTDNAF